MKKLDEHTVIIIGATGGIGSVLAHKLYAADANVVLAARNESNLLKLRDDLTHEHHVTGQLLVVPTDASDPIQIKELFRKSRKKFGKIHGIILSAGTWDRLSVHDTATFANKMLDKHYSTIFKPSVIPAVVAARFFEQQGEGLIVSISSHVAVKPWLPGNLSYGPMKAAASWLMESLAQSMKGTGVRITDLKPAIVNTPDNFNILKTAANRALAVQPEAIAKWVINHFDDPNIPSEKLFDSEVVV